MGKDIEMKGRQNQGLGDTGPGGTWAFGGMHVPERPAPQLRAAAVTLVVSAWTGSTQSPGSDPVTDMREDTSRNRVSPGALRQCLPEPDLRSSLWG